MYLLTYLLNLIHFAYWLTIVEQIGACVFILFVVIVKIQVKIDSIPSHVTAATSSVTAGTRSSEYCMPVTGTQSRT